MAIYPAALKTWVDKIDLTDFMTAAILNSDVMAEIIAIETELGTDPAGAYATVKARLDAELRDANKLQSRNVASDAPSDGQALVWDNAQSRWEPGTIASVSPPIGSILPWHKSFANTPALPSGWLECNGQTISDAGSPYNGQTLPNLNSNTQDGSTSSGMFLRGASTSGTMQADATAVNGLSTDATKGTDHSGYGTTQKAGTTIGTLSSTDPETRPANMTVVWIIRIK